MSSKGYFENVAGQWDTMRQDFFSEAVRDTAYQIAGAVAGETAADIGAGTGFVTEGLLAKGLKVIAVDESEQMLMEMQQKFSYSENVEYRTGESAALPIGQGVVDCAFANMYLHHVESPEAAILEMVRILKPGGKLVITDLDAHSFEFLRTEQYDRWMGFNREDIKGWFTKAGLKNVEVMGINQNCSANSCCGGEKATISIFAASGEK